MKVKFFATYRPITKCKEIELEPTADLKELLHLICKKWPGLRDKVLTPDGLDIGPDAIIMVDGRSVAHLEGINTPLTNESSVAVFPLVAGG